MENTFRLHGTALKFLRIINEISSGHLAKSLGCSFSLISQIESGRIQMTPSDTQKTLDLFGITVEQAEEFMKVIEEAKEVFDNGKRQ